MSNLGSYTFKSVAVKSTVSASSVFGSLENLAMDTVNVSTEKETGYQTTSLFSDAPADSPDSDVVLAATLQTDWSDGERKVQVVISCNAQYPVGGYITLMSGEATPVIKLGPVKVTQKNFITSTQVDLAGDYESTLFLKLSFDPSAMPESGASISVSPSVSEESKSTDVPPRMIRIGEQTLSF